MFIQFKINDYNRLIAEEELIEKFLINKVNRIDDFINRFNNKNFASPFLKINNYDKEALYREKLIRDLIVCANFNEQEVDFFISDIIKNRFDLDYSDKDWFAELECIFKEGHNRFLVQLFLEPILKSNSIHWVIRSIGGELFYNNHSSDSKKFNSISHITDFLDLQSNLNDKRSFNSCFHPLFEPDHLSNFYLLIKYGILKIEQIKKITYHFLQFNKWIFTVNNYYNSNNNSGWLIDQIYNVTPGVKKRYMQNILKMN